MSSSNQVKFVDEYKIKPGQSIETPVSSPRLNPQPPPPVIRKTAFAEKSDFLLPISLTEKWQEQ
jgi:hypothetical protein